MRITALIRSGKHFGNLGKAYGEYRFALSPNEQSTWLEFFKTSIYQTFDEYVTRMWYFYTPPIVINYLVYAWAKKENYKFNRKDPKEFENDT